MTMIVPTFEEIADTLDSAADLIEQRDWGQTHYQNPDTGALCVSEALRLTQPRLRRGAPIDARVQAAWRVLAEHIKGPAPCPLVPGEEMHLVTYPPIIAWNDHPDRTKQEVLDTLRLLAKELRS